ncbi:MAG TPA: hypothetical protein VGI39_44510 [Polyangiaceae bacterium]|jgi:hypothetical protein
MRAFLAPGAHLVPPLEAPARDALILDRTLGETMAGALGRLGFEVVRVHSLAEAEDRARAESTDSLVTLDSLLASPAVLRKFVRAARTKGGETSLVCALPRALGTDHLSHIDGLAPCDLPGGRAPGWSAPLFYLRGAGGTLDGAAPLLLPYKEQILRLRSPVGVVGAPEHLVGVSDSYLCNVSHWAHVLRLNAAAVAGWWFERLRWGGVLGPAWVAWRVLRGFPWYGGRLGGALNGISWGARVNHTAYLELSIVQKGATIGPHASVRNSFIGEGASIGEGARIFGSVIGKGAFVAANSVVTGSVVYPGAFAGQLLMQLSLLGPNACAFTNSNFFDLNFTRNIRVAHRGRFVDSGSRFLGVCLGPDARVSAGVWLGSGREVPPRALLVKPPSEVVAKLGEPEPDVAHAVADGRLVRVTER